MEKKSSSNTEFNRSKDEIFKNVGMLLNKIWYKKVNMVLKTLLIKLILSQQAHNVVSTLIQSQSTTLLQR